jgi:hypothetical protein
VIPAVRDTGPGWDDNPQPTWPTSENSEAFWGKV